MDPGLGRSYRDTERIGDFGYRQIHVEVENDGGSVVWLEPPEPAVQLVVVIDRMGVVAGRGIDPDQGNLHGLTSSEPPLIGTGVDDQPVQPGIPALGISEVRKTAPGTDEGILDRVLRLVRIPEDQPGEAEQPIARANCSSAFASRDDRLRD